MNVCVLAISLLCASGVEVGAFMGIGSLVLGQGVRATARRPPIDLQNKLQRADHLKLPRLDHKAVACFTTKRHKVRSQATCSTRTLFPKRRCRTPEGTPRTCEKIVCQRLHGIGGRDDAHTSSAKGSPILLPQHGQLALLNCDAHLGDRTLR